MIKCECEWDTPPHIIEAARKSMGSIDCDPASSERANKIVKAKEFFTAEDDGLSKKWHENVWLSPPHALMSDFTEAISAKYESGEIKQACILVKDATETRWCQRMMRIAAVICLVKGRAKFLDVEGNPTGAPIQGQIILYFGKNAERFKECFSHLGPCIQHYEHGRGEGD